MKLLDKTDATQFERFPQLQLSHNRTKKADLQCKVHQWRLAFPDLATTQASPFDLPHSLTI